jgi:threonine/homoserine/homoserine lactone efflux protein
MSSASLLAFALGMFLLALAPGPGVAAVVARSINAGVLAALAVITGLVIGDTVFMSLALTGLSAAANMFRPAFQVIKYLGALYLIWLGYKALTAQPRELVVEDKRSVSALREMALGLVVTLGNPKPILFYGALMPTFLDMNTIRLTDGVVLAAVVAIVSYVVLGGYALVADRSRRLLTSAKAVKRLSQSTGVVMIGAGITVATR